MSRPLAFDACHGFAAGFSHVAFSTSVVTLEAEAVLKKKKVVLT